MTLVSCARPRACGRRSRGCCFLFPSFVVLHDALQHGPGVLKDVCHALEQWDAHYAEEAQL